MNHINVTINGRQYRMACEEGQENRLLRLAENLETRVESLRGRFGELGFQRAQCRRRAHRAHHAGAQPHRRRWCRDRVRRSDWRLRNPPLGG